MKSGFDRLLKDIESSAVRAFETVTVTEDGIDLEKEGLKGPSSTWTYMVNDDPFQDEMARHMLRNMVAGGAAAVLLWPILLIWGWYQKTLMKKKRRRI